MDQDGTCMEVGVGPGHIAPDGYPASLPKRGKVPNFRPSLLWPNGWMHQDGTWYGGRPHPRRLCIRWVWGPSPYPKRGGTPNFLPTSMVAKRLHGSRFHFLRPRSTRHCVRCGPSYPQKKGTSTPPNFWPYVYCGQTAEWMKTPLGTEVDLGPGHIVLDAHLSYC